MKVLYVEDDARDAEITMRALSKSAPHLRVETVSSIKDALIRLDRLKTDPIDLVLVDVHLCDGDGLSLLKHIRENILPVAVVVVTGMGDEETAVAALKARADDYVVKRRDYLDNLPVTLESAFNHYRADAARREYPLKVLYAEHDIDDIERTRLHFATHADHIRLEIIDADSQAIAEFIKNQRRAHYDVVLLSLHGPNLDALEMLRSLRVANKTQEPIVLLCGPGEEELAQQGFKYGSSRYLIKNPGYLFQLTWELEDARTRAELAHREAALKESEKSLKEALAELQSLKDRLHEENVYLQEEIRVASDFGEMIGQSDSLKKVLQVAEQVAPLDTTVMILGETGTGKELLAHAIHGRSPRRTRPLVKLNCAAIPAELIESELFGHAKGAFTGASTKRTGRFEIADSGSIFLDEVGELAPDLQAKLLRVLQEGEFEPVGSNRTVKVDVRVIAATNRNLEEAVREGSFRSDLYYRLTVFPITLPPLRDRKNDIPLLVKHFVKELSRKMGKQIDTVPHETMAAFKNYPWPGNIRELRNVIERAVIVTEGSALQLLDSFDSLWLEEPASQPFAHAHAAAQVATVVNAGETLEQTQYNVLLQALKNSYWRIEGPYGAAASLKIHPSKLRAMMKKLGISRPRVGTF